MRLKKINSIKKFVGLENEREIYIGIGGVDFGVPPSDRKRILFSVRYKI